MDDPLHQFIYDGIKREIEVCLKNDCYRSAIMLTYAGMDAMASLGRPEGQDEVTRKNFIDWAARYIRFPCKEQLTGEDLYGARCAMLHGHTVYSKMFKEGKCRIVGYMDKSVPEVRYVPGISPDMVLVSIAALVDAFFKGIDTFLVDLFSSDLKPEIERRLREEIVKVMPASDQ